MKRKFVLSIAIGTLILTMAPLTQAAMETDFIVSPASPNSIKSGVFLYEAKPGDTIEDSFLIRNTATESYEINIYGTDRTTNEEGSKAFKKGWEDITETGSWISLEKRSWLLESEETKTISFQIQIPENAAYKTYTAGIAFEKLFEGENINTALRIIKDVEIKVTETPVEIPKLYEKTLVLKPFFWITTGIFICCVIYVIISNRKTSQRKNE